MSNQIQNQNDKKFLTLSHLKFIWPLDFGLWHLLKSKWLIPIALAAFSFGLYYSTLSPTIYLEDSPEFVTAAHTLSIPHPSGYPLYILTTKLISLVPFLPTVVERINFVSLFWTVAAVVLLYLCLTKLYGRIIATTLSLIFALAPMVWHQATYAEVYGLNTFFFVLLLWLYLRYRDQPTNRRLYLLIFAYGLSLTNHYLPLALAPLFIVLSLRAKPAGRSEAILKPLKLFCFFLLGLLPYLYIPLRASMHPPFAWFNGNLTKLLTYNLAYGYKISWHTLRHIHDVLKTLLETYGWVGWTLAFSGFVLLFWKKHHLRYLAAIGFLLLSIVMVIVLSAGQEYTVFASSFYRTLHVPALLVSLLPLGFLLHWLYQSKFRFWLFYPLLLILLAWPAWDIGSRWLETDKSNFVFLENYSRALLGSLPENATLFVHHDTIVNDPIVFSLAYQRYVNNLRSDVRIQSLTPVFNPPPDFPLLELKNYGLEKEKLAAKYAAAKNIYTTFPRDSATGNGFVYGADTGATAVYYIPDNLTLSANSENLFGASLLAKYYYDQAARLYGQGKFKSGQWFLIQAIAYDPQEFSPYYKRITALRDSYLRR